MKGLLLVLKTEVSSSRIQLAVIAACFRSVEAQLPGLPVVPLLYSPRLVHPTAVTVDYGGLEGPVPLVPSACAFPPFSLSWSRQRCQRGAGWPAEKAEVPGGEESYPRTRLAMESSLEKVCGCGRGLWAWLGAPTDSGGSVEGVSSVKGHRGA